MYRSFFVRDAANRRIACAIHFKDDPDLRAWQEAVREVHQLALEYQAGVAPAIRRVNHDQSPEEAQEARARRLQQVAAGDLTGDD